jgi:hypothetical protein
MVIGGFSLASVQVKKCIIKIFHNMYVCLCMIIGYTGKCSVRGYVIKSIMTVCLNGL